MWLCQKREVNKQRKKYVLPCQLRFITHMEQEKQTGQA